MHKSPKRYSIAGAVWRWRFRRPSQEDAVSKLCLYPNSKCEKSSACQHHQSWREKFMNTLLLNRSYHSSGNDISNRAVNGLMSLFTRVPSFWVLDLQVGVVKYTAYKVNLHMLFKSFKSSEISHLRRALRDTMMIGLLLCCEITNFGI